MTRPSGSGAGDAGAERKPGNLAAEALPSHWLSCLGVKTQSKEIPMQLGTEAPPPAPKGTGPCTGPTALQRRLHHGAGCDVRRTRHRTRRRGSRCRKVKVRQRPMTYRNACVCAVTPQVCVCACVWPLCKRVHVCACGHYKCVHVCMSGHSTSVCMCVCGHSASVCMCVFMCVVTLQACSCVCACVWSLCKHVHVCAWSLCKRVHMCMCAVTLQGCACVRVRSHSARVCMVTLQACAGVWVWVWVW